MRTPLATIVVDRWNGRAQLPLRSRPYRRSGVWASAATANEGKILSALGTEDAAIKGSLFEKLCERGLAGLDYMNVDVQLAHWIERQ
jgi:hypothetical protein